MALLSVVIEIFFQDFKELIKLYCLLNVDEHDVEFHYFMILVKVTFLS